MNFLQVLSRPFSALYDGATRLRNLLFDRGIRTSFEFQIPVISVGNLAVGGTGKTPMVEYLVRLLKDSQHVVTLSRGYGRRTRGYRLAAVADNATTIGDEPYQIYSKFSEIHVAVGEERAIAIPHILADLPDTSCILLDDAFQHRTVKPHLSILLTAHSRPFWKDYILPTGRLRESRTNAKRADLIVVTKCPQGLESSEMNRAVKEIQSYAPEAEVFFSIISYGSPIAHSGIPVEAGANVVLVTGIARADGLKKYVSERYNMKSHLEYGDHHRFTTRDVEKIREQAVANDAVVLTTEKDYMRLKAKNFSELWQGVTLHYLPIEMTFLKDGATFDNHVQKVFE